MFLTTIKFFEWLKCCILEKLSIFIIWSLTIAKTKYKLLLQIEGDTSEINEEEESNEESELPEEQAAIQAYLLDDEVLPPEILNQIIPKFFNSEPYK